MALEIFLTFHRTQTNGEAAAADATPKKTPAKRKATPKKAAVKKEENGDEPEEPTTPKPAKKRTPKPKKEKEVKSEVSSFLIHIATLQ